MTQKQLVDEFQDSLNENFTDIRFTKKDSDLILETLSQMITRNLQKGEVIRIQGIGTFKTAEHAAHPAYSPKTGEKVYAAAKIVPKFSPSTILKDAVAL